MKNKGKRLINLHAERCIEPGFYKTFYPNESLEDARILFFGSYSEAELDQKSRDEFQAHLEKCSFCSAAFKEFENASNLQSLNSIPSAVCPSSELLDHYVFDKSLLSTIQIERIEHHINECELCSEELGWLKNLETPSRSRNKFSWNWVQSAMAAAAAVILALSAFLFWQKSSGREAEEQLRALATIQEPQEINYAALLATSEPLNQESELVFDRALKDFQAQRFDEARLQLETVISNQPRHSASLYLLAYAYYKLNRPEKAFELCNLSESIHPHSYERCMFLVNLALKTRHYDRARLEIATLYHEAPDAPDVSRLYHEIMRLTEKRNFKL